MSCNIRSLMWGLRSHVLCWTGHIEVKFRCSHEHSNEIEKKWSQGSSIVDTELSVLMPAPGFSHIQPCGELCLLAFVEVGSSWKKLSRETRRRKRRDLHSFFHLGTDFISSSPNSLVIKMNRKKSLLLKNTRRKNYKVLGGLYWEGRGGW